MDNKFFCKRIAVKGQSIFSQRYERQLGSNRIRSTQRDNREMSDSSEPIGTDPQPNFYKFIKSFNKRYETKVFKCRYIGCGKIFITQSSLNYHSNKHLIRKQSQDFRPMFGPKTSTPLATPLRNNLNEKTSKDQNIGSFGLNQSIGPSIGPFVPSVPSLGYSSSKTVKTHYTSDRFLGQKRCICNFCGHKSYGFKASTRMAVHINGQHLKRAIFRCDVEGCTKTFCAPNTLRTHKMNHFCGFGVRNGKTLDTICGNKSINRFRRQLIINGMKFFKCNFGSDCQYLCGKANSLKRHIHDKHLCPNRVTIRTNDDKTHYNSIEIVERFDQFCQPFQTNGQQLFKCKKCEFFTEKLNGVLAHIRLKHLTSKDRTYYFNSEVVKSLQTREGFTFQANNSEKKCHYFEDNKKKNDMKKETPKREPYVKWMPFSCDKCDKTFDDLLIFRKHIKSHINFGY